MLLPILAALLMFVEAPAAATAPPAPAAVASAPAEPAAPVDPVFDEIDKLLQPWKGKSGDGLRGRLGLSHRSQQASDGDVVFWLTRTESMACGVGPAGDMRCGSSASAECGLGIAFDKTGKVKNWKAQGAPDACRKFADALAKP